MIPTKFATSSLPAVRRLLQLPPSRGRRSSPQQVSRQQPQPRASLERSLSASTSLSLVPRLRQPLPPSPVPHRLGSSAHRRPPQPQLAQGHPNPPCSVSRPPRRLQDSQGTVITAGADVTFAGAQAAATATALPGGLLLTQFVQGAQASATATVSTGDFAVQFTGAQATCIAFCETGVFVYDSAVDGAQATSTATGQDGTFLYDALVDGARGLATATGLGGHLGHAMPTHTKKTKTHVRTGQFGFTVTTGAKTRLTVRSGKTIVRT